MIGAYIFVRAVEMMITERKSDGAKAVIIVLGLILMGVDSLCVMGLIASGSSIPTIR